MNSHADQIRSVLATYERSLNTSDAALAASCYTPDGVFMPTTLPTALGGDMEGAYRQIFDAIRLDVIFTIDELAITSDDSAYALTRSNGTQTVLATGDRLRNPTGRSSCSATPTPAGRSPATCSTNPHDRRVHRSPPSGAPWLDGFN